MGQKSSIYPKIHIFKITFFTKFTILKSNFSQNSQIQNHIFLKIHNFSYKIHIFQILGNFWKKNWLLPQCATCSHLFGLQVYPIFEVLAPVPRFLFMLACSMFGALLYIIGKLEFTLEVFWSLKKCTFFKIGEILNNLVWAKPKSSMTSAAGDTSTENVHSMTTRSKGKKPKKVD